MEQQHGKNLHAFPHKAKLQLDTLKLIGKQAGYLARSTFSVKWKKNKLDPVK